MLEWNFFEMGIADENDRVWQCYTTALRVGVKDQRISFERKICGGILHTMYRKELALWNL